MPEKRSQHLLNQLVLSYGLLVVAFTIGRAYECWLLISHAGPDSVTAGYITGGFVNDLQASVWTTLLVFALSRPAASFFRRQRVLKVRAHLISIIAIVHISLIAYFGATLIPLGAEIWAYSLTEMTNTVVASEQVTALGLLLVSGGYLLFYWIGINVLSLDLVGAATKKATAIAVVIVLLLFATPALWSADDHTPPDEKDKRANKLSYVVAQSFASFDVLGAPASDVSFGDSYPLMREKTTRDVLGPFFREFDSPPNIVFILVESLGGEFVGTRGQWTGFTPYLDSLAKQGLYWENGLSLSGRTFGLVPSLLGSLPFGRQGFMGLGPYYPRHQSLISLLEKRGYHTSFYSGYDTYFDGLNFFLAHQGTDFVLNKHKIETQLDEAENLQNYWGFDDKLMLNFASTILDTLRALPRLEIYHTLQSHSPFTVPDPKKYNKLFERQLNMLNLPQKMEDSYRNHRSELTTLLFGDQSIQEFMNLYRQRDHYKNTIFIITGDHWLIPVPQTSAISRYHVPIIIYSPKLKQPVHFESVNTHANITPSLVTLLDQRTSLSMPDSVHWLGGVMDTSRQFRNIHSIPLMRSKNRISDYLDKEYYLYGNELYELGEGLALTRTARETMHSRLVEKLNYFRSLNKYVVENDRLYRGKPVQVDQQYAFLTKYDTLFLKMDSLGLSVDQQFEQARQKAFNNDYEPARAIARRILLQAPDYYDVRILLGRTYAWEEKTREARIHFEEVLKADPTYYDTYNAYFDNEFWAGHYREALDIINRGLEYHPLRQQFLERKIKVLSALERDGEAQKIYRRLKQVDTEYENLPELKKHIAK